MKRPLDIIVAAIGLTIFVAGHVYVFVFAKPAGAPQNGIMLAAPGPPLLYPACEAYPDGLNGKPCAEAETHEKTGRLVLHGPK